MKKLLSLALSFILLLSLSACGSSAGSEVTEAKTIPVETTSPAIEPTVEETLPAPVASIEETVLWEDSGVKITAKSLEIINPSRTELKLFIENQSGKNLNFQCPVVSVNGYMVESNIYLDVEDMQQADVLLVLSDYCMMTHSVKQYGITNIAELELRFHIEDITSDSWQTFTVTPPLLLKTSLNETVPSSIDVSGEVVHESDTAKIVMKGFVEDEILGPCIEVYIENNSDSILYVQPRNIRINGDKIFDPYVYDVFPGKKQVAKLSLDELDGIEISGIESVEISFQIYAYEQSSRNLIEETDIAKLSF